MGWVLSGTILDPGDPLGLGSVGNNSRPRRSLGVGVSGRKVTDLGLGDLLGVRLAQVPHRQDVVVSVIHHHQLVPSILYITKKNNRLFLFSTRFNHENHKNSGHLKKKDQIQL